VASTGSTDPHLILLFFLIALELWGKLGKKAFNCPSSKISSAVNSATLADASQTARNVWRRGELFSYPYVFSKKMPSFY
jgi:hypothetical protein